MIKLFKRLWEKLSIQKRQYGIAMLLMLVIAMLGFIIYMEIMGSKVIIQKENAESKPYNKNIEVVGEKIDVEETWRYKQEDKIKGLQDGISAIKSDLKKALKSPGKREGVKGNAEQNEISILKSEIASLRQMIGRVAMSQDGSIAESKQIKNNMSDNTISKIKLSLEGNGKEEIAKNKEDTIPATSFAKGVLLSGVDASTSLSSSADPRPMLIRLVDPGNLPRKFKSDLKDCRVIASSYGEISSERVFVRLEKLTCIERCSGDIVETDIHGYVTGEDGRAGIKGDVVEKGRGYLTKSILGGVLQGLAGVFNPEQNAVLNPVGAIMPKRSAGDKFNEGMMSGASGSMDRLSKYYIERAESIQPVVRIERVVGL